MNLLVVSFPVTTLASAVETPFYYYIAVYYGKINEPGREKTIFLPRRKQRRRSASQ